jgi:CRISPR/Cas system-associated exonuclease Cas4 (RecB family)
MQGLPLLTPLPESPSTEPVAAPGVAVTKSPATGGPLAAKTDPAPALSPSQVRCFLDCPARWWFKYRLQLPERKNSSLALGLAVHQALEVNFREKLETQEDLETTGVLMVFREAWMEQVPQTEFTSGESQGDLRRLGERLVAKYMDEVAPTVEPAAVELDVQGEIRGVAVRGRVDVLDVEGRLIDFKTASRRPSCVSPDYAFQLATYRQITPGASGEVRIDSLVKTQTVQIVQQAYTVSKPDIRATRVLYPMAQKAMGTGMYCPNRQSMLCSQKHCSFWKHCEQEFGGSWDVLQGFERFCKLRQKSHPPGYASRNALNTNQLFA